MESEVEDSSFWTDTELSIVKPYVFARDREIEEKIANDKRKRREAEESFGTEHPDKQGPRKRSSYVPGGEWGYGCSGD